MDNKENEIIPEKKIKPEPNQSDIDKSFNEILLLIKIILLCGFLSLLITLIISLLRAV